MQEECYQNALALLDEKAEETRDSIQRLVDAGATQFLVFNSDDIGSNAFFAPRTESTPVGEIVSDPLARDLSLQYNALLHEKIIALQGSVNASVHWFDLFDVVEKIKLGQLSHSIGNVVESCMQSGVVTPPCSESTIDNYFYFDEVHWTTSAHRVIANEVLAQLETQQDFPPTIVSVATEVLDTHVEFSIVANDIDGSVATVDVEIMDTRFQGTQNPGGIWKASMHNLNYGAHPYRINVQDNAGNVSSIEGNVLVCIDDTIENHIAENRVYSLSSITYFFWWPTSKTTYYIMGSEQSLGSDISLNDTLSLYPSADGVYELCVGG